MVYRVSVLWDADAHVWVASSEDIPGLNTEAPELNALIQRVLAVAPELLELNRAAKPGLPEVSFVFSERRERLSAAA